MSLKEIYKQIEKPLSFIVNSITLVIWAILGISFISKKINNTLLALLNKNILDIFLLALTTSVISLWIGIERIHRRLVIGFKDNFRNNLFLNWDFEGDWSIERGTLRIRNSERGGITKVGALWENYTLSFDARIINECLGVIVRAQNLDDYYMFQIRTDLLRPHRRVTVPVIPLPAPTPQQNQPINFATGFQVINPTIPINPQLNAWFNVKVTVRGQAVTIIINGVPILQRESFLQIPTGKVGFRNWGPEEAIVKKVKVILDA